MATRRFRNPKCAEASGISTVSLLLIEDLLDVLRRMCAPSEYERILQTAQIPGSILKHPHARIGRDQLVKLYQTAAVNTGDEMMGLWSRPIRTSALKNICRVVIDAPSIGVALHRFCQMWNLMLDDYELQLVRTDKLLSVALRGRNGASRPNRFGHTLMLKLAHGISSWLAGRELPVEAVSLAFPRPDFAHDYPVLFPCNVDFDVPQSQITFSAAIFDFPIERKRYDMHEFLVRAPRDWIFTSLREHAFQLKVRDYLARRSNLRRSLDETASHFNMSRRTLIRKLAAEGQSFQKIKDGLRRDIAIRDLQVSNAPLPDISEKLGFSSVAVFHRAFKGWTGMTPAAYRAVGHQ